MRPKRQSAEAGIPHENMQAGRQKQEAQPDPREPCSHLRGVVSHYLSLLYALPSSESLGGKNRMVKGKINEEVALYF